MLRWTNRERADFAGPRVRIGLCKRVRFEEQRRLLQFVHWASAEL
jgi:hypothetical protein